MCNCRQKIKILYDISILGEGHRNHSHRTGVFRTVENLAYQLSLSKECELAFCSGNSLNELAYCLDYMKSDDSEKLRNISLACPNLTRLKRITLKKLANLNHQINNYDKQEYHKTLLYLKLLRRIVNYADKLISIFPNNLIPNDILNKTDIFHSTFYHIPEQLGKSKHKATFLTVHDLIPLLYPNLFLRYREYEESRIKKTLGSLKPEDWVICVSSATKNDLCNYRKDIDPYRVSVIYWAASDLFYPFDNFEERQFIQNKYHIPDVQYFLGVSTLEPRKNFEFTLRCFVKILQQENIKDLYLVLVGNRYADDNNIFEKIYNNNWLKDRVVYAGYVADEDLAAIYSGAIAFVYPSICEGFGLPPLEAMKCGVPVITSNTTSLPEVVGEAGIMVSPTDEDALCNAMLEVYKNSSLRKTMSLKSLERAKQFSWEKCTQETINAYKTALNTK